MISKSEVSELFIVLFGRPTEGEGNTYWVNESSANGWGMIETSNAILNLDITKSFLGETLNNNESFVKHLFKNAVNLTEFVSDEQKAGLKYWVDLLDNGTVSKADLVGHFVNAAKDPSNAGANQDLFNNKVIVSNYVADTIAKLPLDGLTPDQQNALIQKTVDIINNVTSNSSSVESAKGEVDALKSELPNPGSTYDLTEGNDNLKGTDLDDTFNGTTYVGNGTNKSTLSAFDKIDGGAGRDTLNAIFTANNNAAAATKLDQTEIDKSVKGVTNVENINIISDLETSGDFVFNGYEKVGFNVLGDIASFATDASKSVNVETTGTITAFTAAGTGKVDVVAGKITALTADSATSVNLTATNDTITLTSANAATSVNLKTSGAAKNATITSANAAKNITIDATGVAAVTSATAVENLTVKHATNVTLAGNMDKLATVTLDNAALTAAIDIKSASTLNLINSSVNGHNISTAAKDVTVHLSGAAAKVKLNTTAATDQTVTLKANATDNSLEFDSGTAKTTSVTASGSGKTLVIKGAEVETLVNIDTTAFNGAADVSFGKDAQSGKFSVKTGTGDDKIEFVGTTLTEGSVIDGGAGNDTIAMKSAALTSANFTMIKNIENVAISDAVATADLSSSAFKNIIITTKEAADTTLTINKDQVINFTAADAGSVKLITVKLNDVTGANDVVKIVLDAAAKDASIALGTEATDKALVIDTGIETLNITSLVKATSPENTANTVNAKLTDVTSIIIDGDAKITLGHAGTAGTDYSKVSMIDASALKAGLTFDASAITLGANATIKGGSGADSITVKGGNIVVDLVAGGDDTITLKKGAEKTDITTVNNFNAGDKIDITDAKNGTFTFNKITMNSDANLDDYINKAVAGDGSTNSAVSYFHHNGYTYVVVDGTAGATFTKATDTIIKLSGTLDLKLSGDNVVVDDGSVI
ncbi:S-layer protein [Campylobacter fetus subsp. fetus]|nr:S-layer protein [Campylobacter fetus]QYA61101.1 S-layer protein [Campylobacter fetus subsp. fetus]QYA64581.1 S-layer protein [Campylobacter fetus subsp. fetus]SQH29819.1 surface layer protein SapB9 [Campylobacter fetus subsp. fetus]